MHEVTVDSTPDNGRWLPLAEAARELGVSEKTARRRAKAGQLEARQIPTQRGPTWQVRVPTTVDTGDRVDSQGTHTATMLELVRLVGELQPKAEAAAMWQARAELLADRLAAAESKLLALAAPPSPVEAPTAPEPTDLTTELSAPWWSWIALLTPVLVTAGVVAVVLLTLPR